jgi:hypothetical protein
MNQIAAPKLARIAVLLIMVCGILVFGANRPAWATPAQAPFGQTVTVTPGGAPGPRLTINQLRCSGENVVVEFIVRQLPDNTTGFGSVSYTVNGQNRTANFDQRTGGDAGYVDSIPRSAQPSNNAYEISAASVDLTVGAQTITVGLENPNRFTVVCRQESNSSDDCPELGDGNSVGPGAEAELRLSPWRLRIRVIKCDSKGRFELKLISPGDAPGPNAGEVFAPWLIEITYFNNEGKMVSNPTFTGSMTLCYDYSAADVAQAGGVGNLTIQTYDPAQAKWVALATTVEANSSICTELSHLSTYAVAMPNPAQITPAAAPVSNPPNTQPAVAPAVSNAPQTPGAVPRALPKTGAPSESLVPFWLWALIGLLIGMACTIFAWGNVRAQSAAKDPPR